MKIRISKLNDATTPYDIVRQFVAYVELKGVPKYAEVTRTIKDGVMVTSVVLKINGYTFEMEYSILSIYIYARAGRRKLRKTYLGSICSDEFSRVNNAIQFFSRQLFKETTKRKYINKEDDLPF